MRFTITENKSIAPSVFKMTLEGDVSAVTAPGQFVNIALDGKYLRRPISICDIRSTDDSENGILTLIYKTIGSGTEQMSESKPGTVLDILIPLGNGYDINKSFSRPLLIGGGVGVPPMYMLAKRLIEKGYTPNVILGFNTKAEIFYEDEFKSLGCNVTVTTADGSYGTKGFVTAAFSSIEFDYTFSCGPLPMLKAVYYSCVCNGQYSFEERMGCGFGACMGCTCKTITGYKRICKDGPVLERSEILW